MKLKPKSTKDYKLNTRLGNMKEELIIIILYILNCFAKSLSEIVYWDYCYYSTVNPNQPN